MVTVDKILDIHLSFIQETMKSAPTPHQMVLVRRHPGLHRKLDQLVNLMVQFIMVLATTDTTTL